MKNPILALVFLISSCSTMDYRKSVESINLKSFMGTWYVQAGRFTFLEKNVYNAKEVYTWNEAENRIDINFSFNQNSLKGPLKTINQKGWISDHISNSKWIISPLWPLRFDYLILACAKNYEWTAIGVPNQKYLWIMTRERHYNREEIKSILKELEALHYNVSDITFVEHD